jgi:hypothetical protein
MFAIHRPKLGARLASLALATGAAAITGAIQASAQDLPAFTCTNKSGGVANAPGTVAAIRVAHHNGYDRLVLEFAGSGSVPQYQLTRQASSTFEQDASGIPVTLEGSAGIRTVLHNADIAAGVANDLKPRLPEIREVRQIGNFERVVSYGVGLKDAACFRAFELSGPARLVIDVQTPADAPAATSQPVTPTAAATAQPSLPSDLAATGHPATAGQPAGMPFVAILLGLLAVTAGLTIAGLRRVARK